MLNDEIYALLSVDAIADLVGDRIYPVTVPDNWTYSGPFLVYSRVSNQSEESHSGSSGLATARYQFSCYAKRQDGGNKKCRTIAEQVRLAIQNYRGGSIQSVSHAGDLDIFDADALCHHVPIDFMITYSESQPA